MLSRDGRLRHGQVDVWAGGTVYDREWRGTHDIHTNLCHSTYKAGLEVNAWRLAV